jgi:uncharacterized protein YpmS
MKIDFPDKSYVEAESKEGKVVISIGANSQDNPLSMVVNTVELSKEEFSKLISNL